MVDPIRNTTNPNLNSQTEKEINYWMVFFGAKRPFPSLYLLHFPTPSLRKPFVIIFLFSEKYFHICSLRIMGSYTTYLDRSYINNHINMIDVAGNPWGT